MNVKVVFRALGRALLCSILGATVPALMFGQFGGSIQGTVTDQTGGAVVGIALQLTNLATGVVTTTKTAQDGVYHFVSLGAGKYEVKALGAASGMSDFSVTVELSTAQTLDVPITLRVRAQAQEIEVTGEPPTVDTAETRSQATIGQAALNTVPIAERSVFPLVTLAPGVVGLGSDLLSDEGTSLANFSPQITFDISANGHGPGANMFVVDGLDITSNIAGGAVNLEPNPDSLQEVSIQTNTFSSEYGRASSLQVMMTTKSGTNDFHGTASDYFTSQQLWAGTEFVHNYAAFHTNDISGALGGPISKKHQFFFFGSAEVLRSTFPAGAGSATTANPAAFQSITFEDPAFTTWAQQHFPGTLGTTLLTKYPANQATSTGVALTAADVFPNTCATFATSFIPCSLPMVDTGFFNASSYRNGLQFNTRLDKYFQNDRLYANYYRTTMQSGGPSPRPDMATTSQYWTDALQLNETHTFSPTTLNEAAFGFTRVEGLAPATGTFDVPVVSVVGMSSGIGNGFAQGDYVQHNYHWRDVLSHVHGPHTLKFGYEGWQGDDVALFAGPYSQPNFTFNNLLDLVQDRPYSESNLAYDPVTAQPAKGQYMFAMHTHGLFAQDTWKLSRRLTVTYGVRWDNFGNPYPTQGTVLANFFFGPGQNFDQQIANGSMIQRPNVYNNSPFGFSPRIGLAFDPTGSGKTVIRGGFGVYHDWETLGEAENQLKGNPPGWVVPNFLTGTTTAPVFAMGTSNTYPFGFPYPQFTAIGLNEHGGLVGEQPSVGGTDPNLKTPVAYNYTVTLERALTRTLTASVGYAGSYGNHLISGSDGNGVQSYGTDINRFAGDLIVNNNVLHRLNPSFGSITYSFNEAASRYNSLIVSAKENFGSRGFFSASYTHSRSYDDGGVYPTAQLLPQYWGPSPWDAPDRVSFTGTWFVPGVPWQNRVAHALTAGWQLSATSILQSGYPFTVYTSAPFEPTFNPQGQVVGMQAGSGDYNADGNNNDWPTVPSTGYKTSTSRQAYLNGLFPASAFTIPAMGTEGNESWNRFRGPGYADVDLALIKDTQIVERVKLQLRFEFYNLLNRANLTGMNSDLSSASFGRATSQSNPRWIQLGAKLVF